MINQYSSHHASNPSFHNCTRAIWVEGTAADIANNYMTACGYGVQVQLAQGRQVFVNGNLMEVSRTGIDLLSNAPLPVLEVDGNDITTTSRGINIEETGIAFADARLHDNTVTLAGKGFGIRLRGVNGLEASSNDIYMEQAVQTAAGIRVNGVVNCTIRENYVAGPGPDNLFFVGLDVLDGSSSVFDCNTFTELGTGAAFEGSCMGSTVSTNVFEPGELGMGQGLVYRNSLNIGVQSHAGNLWEVNTGLPNEGYDVAAAVNYDNDLVLLSFNSYTVNDDTPPIYPSSFDFPNFAPALQQAAENAWFLVDEGISDTCIQNGGLELPEVKDIHVKTARGEQLDEDYPGAMLWAAQLQLYRELDVEEWPADEVLDSFFLANDTTLLSAFYHLEKGRDSLYKLSPAESAQLQQWGDELDGLIGFILEKDSLIAAGALGLESTRDSLLDDAAALCAAMDSLENIVLQARISFAGTLLAANSALGDTAVYQTNEKLANKLFLNTIAQGVSAFDAQQTDSLLSIADQCSLSGGRAVHYARSLYQLVADSTFVDVCETGSEKGVSKPLIILLEEPDESIRIFPNPTSGELVVEGFCGRIDIVNQLGQPVWSKDLPEGEFLHLFNLQNLPNGIYFLRAWLKNEPIYQSKLIISK
ncbi:MAG: right-handed parallel beta-helix repeat-containing protein [Phaeodactylibacter sp.]|nr:right-handed parallel beta-helix repeat-containing protein [Phaeodactylibacter sp.]